MLGKSERKFIHERVQLGFVAWLKEIHPDEFSNFEAEYYRSDMYDCLCDLLCVSNEPIVDDDEITA